MTPILAYRCIKQELLSFQTSLVPVCRPRRDGTLERMSENSPDDDFFGIQCLSSSLDKSYENAEAVPEIQSSGKAAVAMRSRFSVKESAVEKDDSELSGTEYLDRVFFPSINVTSDSQKENEQPSDFFEECFFPGVKSNETSRTPTTSSEERSQNENSPDHERIKTSSKGSIGFSSEPKQGSSVNNSRKESYLDDYDSEVTHSSEENAVDKIRRQFISVWKMSQDELVDLMVNRVLYKNDDIVAFDKPYGLAYSGASSSVPQLDRLLQKIKARVVPKCERLYLVKSLDKYQSGIVLFATNSVMQLALKEEFQNGHVEQVTRCIVRDELQDSPLKITIPLIKTVKNRDFKLLPLITNSTKKEIFYVESDCRTVQGKQYVSSVEVRTRREVPHQIRAHLAMARCPLIGDSKYSNSSPRPPPLSHHVLKSLNMTDSQARKIPMYLHLKEIHLPAISRLSAPIRISAPIPQHFVWMLKKLNLLKVGR